MRKTVALAALWMLVATAAATAAWQGVNVVGDQVTDERPAPLAASDIQSRVEGATSTTTAPSTTAPAESATTTVVSTTPSTTPGTGATTPTPTSPSTTMTAASAPSETRTYNLQGGTASLRFTPDGVTVVFANPADGYSVEVEPDHGNGVRVEFESEFHESRVDGWWDNGPVDRVREDD